MALLLGVLTSSQKALQKKPIECSYFSPAVDESTGIAYVPQWVIMNLRIVHCEGKHRVIENFFLTLDCSRMGPKYLP